LGLNIKGVNKNYIPHEIMEYVGVRIIESSSQRMLNRK
jgi:hypothetical protein